MIENLKAISDNNAGYISNEEKIAEKRLSVEVWDRDIYQKKRVDMDAQIEIQNVLNGLAEKEKELKERDEAIRALKLELMEAEEQHGEFLDDLAAKDQQIAELEAQMANMEDERARRLREEQERMKNPR
jgi:chromosome segregation ATPase